MSPATLTAPPSDAVATEITVPLAAFRDALERVNTVVAARATLPVLQCVLLTAAPGLLSDRPRVTLSATNLDVAIDADVLAGDHPAFDVSAAVRVPLAADLLLAAVQHGDAPTMRLTLSAGGGLVTARVGRARYQIPALPEGEWPEAHAFEPPTAFPVVVGAVSRAIARVAYAASTQESRPIMNGVCIEPTADGLSCVAIDGYRVASAVLPIDETGASGLTRAVILPRGAADAIGRVFGDDEPVALQYVDGHVAITSTHRRLRTRLVEGPYPNWRQVQRAESPLSATFDRAALITTLKRVAFVARGDNKRLVLTFTPTKGDAGTWRCTLAAATEDKGAASDSLLCRGEGALGTFAADGATHPGFRVSCNASYLLDAITKSVRGAEVTLEFLTPDHAIHCVDRSEPTVFTMIMTLRMPDHVPAPTGAED